MAEIDKSSNNLQKHGIGVVILLIIQYLLGMIVNLFVTFPQNKNIGQMWEFAWKQLPIALHILIGFLLLINSLALIIRAIFKKDRQWIIASTIGALAILTAGLAGSLFVPSQTDIYSYIMAASFLVAFIAFSWGIFYTSKTNRK